MTDTPDFSEETTWITPKQCAKLMGSSESALEKRRVRGQWPPFTTRSGRPRYPGDYIKQEMAKGIVTNTVQGAAFMTKPAPPIRVPPEVMAVSIREINGVKHASVLWRPDHSAIH